MLIKDAAKILNLSGQVTPAIVKQAYRKACSLYHPDRNPAGAEMMKAVNLAYETLKEFEGDVGQDPVTFAADLNNALNAIITLNGLEIEICGAWVWVFGNTKEYKSILKDNGYKWAPKKKGWYYRPEDYRSSNRGDWSMEEIRDHHGSNHVKTKKKKELNAA